MKEINIGFEQLKTSITVPRTTVPEIDQEVSQCVTSTKVFRYNVN